LPPGWCPFPAMNEFLLPPPARAQDLREDLSGIFSVHMISTTGAPLSARRGGYPLAYPPVYAQLIHRLPGVIKKIP
jgi:hypothetical protein